MSVPVFIDTFNLYHCTHLRYDGRLVDYVKMLDFLRETYDVKNITMYVQRTTRADSFIRMLNEQPNVFVKTRILRNKKSDNFDVDLTLDVLQNLDEKIVICSSSANLIPLLQNLTHHRVTTYVHSSGIPKEFTNYSVAKELGHGLLKAKTELLVPTVTVPEPVAEASVAS